MADSLVFVHLSDIHFNKRWHDEFELDKDLRDQLESDALLVRKNFEQLTGIVISGDVAYGGKIEDYKIAREWLKELCAKIECREQAVWCVPGNHDVDQKIFDDSFIVRTLHERLRPSSPEQIDQELTDCMRDPESAKALLRSIDNYNTEFASKFKCTSRVKPLTWQHDLHFTDGSTLRLYGINSALVSDKYDDDKRLIVGTIQVTPKEEPHVVYMAICHHPPDWLLDYEALNHSLNARAKIQLFGHKHFQRIEEINGCLRIGSGAVHPSRKESRWKPRYNWIQLTVVRSDEGRFLEARIYPRVWSDSSPKFVADFENCDQRQEFRTYKLSLPDSLPPKSAATLAVSPTPTVTSDRATDLTTPSADSGVDVDAARTLTYRFLDLPHVTRIEIAQSLRLIENEDEGLVDFDLLERVIIRATERKQLEKLWELVEEEHGDKQNPVNPFLGQ